MHGDKMEGEADEEVDEEEADRQAEEAAFQPFDPDDFSTPGEGFEVAHSTAPSGCRTISRWPTSSRSGSARLTTRGTLATSRR